MMKLNDFAFHVVDQLHGQQERIKRVTSRQWGSTNEAAIILTDKHEFFVKWNDAALIEIFHKEEAGLRMLESNCDLCIPKVLNIGIVEDRACLLMEPLSPRPLYDEAAYKLGEGIAHLHANKAELHGLEYDNFIGRLPQSNSQHKSWLDFYKLERLMPQLKLAVGSNRVDVVFQQRFEKFVEKLEHILPESEASLLHGDLWAGNKMNTSKGPSIYDPAIYYGAREMDIAMTTLFHGYGITSRFYDAYRSNYPLHAGFDDLIDVYNLYPLMVHVNLFGGDYINSVNEIIVRYT